MDLKKAYIISSPMHNNPMYIEIKKIIEKARKDQCNAIDEIIKHKIGWWKILPKSILKRVFIMETHSHPNQLTCYYVMKNKITRREFTLVIEGKTTYEKIH